MPNSCRKGADGERELAALLRSEGFDIDRGGTQTYGTVPDLSGLPGIHIEVKRTEKLNLLEAIKQAIRDAVNGELPAVFHRRNREPWLVTMTLDDWILLYKEAKK